MTVRFACLENKNDAIRHALAELDRALRREREALNLFKEYNSEANKEFFLEAQVMVLLAAEELAKIKSSKYDVAGTRYDIKIPILLCNQDGTVNKEHPTRVIGVKVVDTSLESAEKKALAFVYSRIVDIQGSQLKQ